MATIHTLQARYENVHRVPIQQIPTFHRPFLNDLAAQVDSGDLSLQQAVDAIIDRAVWTTSVASINYQFFTGAVPREAGLDYLVNPTGPNPNNLNSVYYRSFSTENRYINFAVNLGAGGEGQAAFQAGYGALSISQTVGKAYAEIFGMVPDAAKIDDLANALVPDGRGGQFTRWEYFATYGGDGVNGLGTKAAFVGWLLSVAAREDLGPYAQANTAFLSDLAGDGEAAFFTDILAVYGPDGPAVAGVSITVAANQSVGLDATDPALRSTAADDIVQGAGGLDAVQSVATGDGRDMVTFAAAAAGLIDTGDGDDSITVGVLPKYVEVLGGAENGLIRSGAGDDVITVTQHMAFGARIDGGVGFDTAIVAFNPPDIGSPAPQFIGIERLVITQATGYGRTLDLREEGDLREVVFEGDNGFTFQAATSGLKFTLRDVSGGLLTFDYERTLVASTPFGGIYIGASAADIHLDGVTAPTQLAFNNLEGPLRLTVDGDSALSAITGADRLVVAGDGTLTLATQLSVTFIDARDASEIHIDRFEGGFALLTPGDDTIAVDLTQGFGIESYDLGQGADVFSIYYAAAGDLRFSNLRLSSQSVDSQAAVGGFEKGVDRIELGPGVTQVTNLTAFVGDAASLETALLRVSPHLAADRTGLFEYGGGTYVYHQDATVGVNTGDGLLQVLGVTGMSVGTGAGPFDIHYG